MFRASFAERRWVFTFALAVMALTTLPYFIGFAREDANWRFTGFVFGVEDGNSYLAKMARGSAGDWLFRTPYSALPQPGMVIFLPYLLLGKLAAPPARHEQLVALYHLFRIGAGILAVLATYDFLALFLEKVRSRRLGLIVAVLGGGLGWLLLLMGEGRGQNELPLEFYSPESFGFLALFGIPHLALARALLLWSLVRFLRQAAPESAQAPTLGEGLKTGALWLLAALAQPLTGILVGVVVSFYLAGLGAWLAWRLHRKRFSDWPRWRRSAKWTLLAGLLPAVFWIYTLCAFQFEPLLKTWTLQSGLPSPYPLHYLLAYGLYLPFAFLGGKALLRDSPWTGWLPVAWVLGLPLLAYAPFSMQRRLPEGVWVAIVSLGMVFIEKRRPRWLERPGPAAAILAASTLTTLLLWAGGLRAAMRPARPLFRPAQEISLFEKLSQIASPEDVVLSAYETGNALPAWTPQFVVIGHGPESFYFDSTGREVRAFYREGTADAARRDLLRNLSVDYVVWGPAERSLGGWSPDAEPDLVKLWEQGDYSLYKPAW